MRFSETTQAFYDEAFEDNAAVDDIPADVREITMEQYQDFYSAINSASRVYVDKDRFVISTPRPSALCEWDEGNKAWFMSDAAKAQQQAQDIANAERQRQTLTDEATQKISLLQTKVMIGRSLLDSEKQTLNTWLDYIDQLNLINVSAADNISWPRKPV
ncbi:tail fiber assembly protein [Pantoea agglomerans]